MEVMNQRKKRKQAGFARTTISLPRTLKQRMTRQGRLVNWSAVATRAFRARLDEMDQQAEHRSLDDVVARLKRTVREADPQGRAVARGERRGRDWAMNVATQPQLERIAALRGRHSDEEWQDLFNTEAGWRKLAKAIDPEVKQPRRIWRHVLQDRSDHPAAFYAAFAAGALEIWEQVKDRL